MAAVLGKRKRRVNVDGIAHSSVDNEKAEKLQALMRKHFEGTFEPLEVAATAEQGETSSSEEDEEQDDDWGGFSDSDTPETVEIIDHSIATSKGNLPSKEERKAFMSSKILTSDPSKPSKSKSGNEPEDSSVETSLLKNDLELQRLLRESHLLTSSPSDELSVTGKARHKALDLRLQALGSKKSTAGQKNMPMSHRKGIEGKKRMKEDVRRTEARENGIILEKERREVKKPAMRERGIGGPSVGKFKGGTLQLSQKDLKEIQGPSRGSGRSGRGGRGLKRGGKRGGKRG